jgi:hypothetical protein
VSCNIYYIGIPIGSATDEERVKDMLHSIQDALGLQDGGNFILFADQALWSYAHNSLPLSLSPSLSENGTIDIIRQEALLIQLGKKFYSYKRMSLRSITGSYVSQVFTLHRSSFLRGRITMTHVGDWHYSKAMQHVLLKHIQGEPKITV